MESVRALSEGASSGRTVRVRRSKRSQRAALRSGEGSAGERGAHSLWDATSFTDRVPELVEYWRIISKRRFEVIGLAVAVAILATVIVFAMTPIFRATATVLIEQSKQKVVSVEEVYTGIGSNREHFQTQAEIIKSREVVERVVTKYKLWEHPEFATVPTGVTTTVTNWVKGTLLGQSPNAGLSEERLQKRAVSLFISRMQVEPVRLSQLVKVSYESPDQNFAAQMANALVEAYIENDFDARYKMSQQATDWLNERLADLKSNLDKSEKALQSYREREGMVDSKGVALGGASKTLEEASQRLVEAKRRRSEAEYAYSLIKKGPQFYDEVPDIARNQLVQRAKENANDADRKLAELAERYGKEHPRYVQAEGELKAAKDNLRRVMENAAQQVMKEYEAARASESALESAAAGARGQIKDLNRKEIELGGLEREVQSNRQIYQTFLSRFKETNATESVQAAVARVVERAVPPSASVKPKRLQSVVLASIMGIVLGIAIALLLERLDNTIKGTESAEQRLQLPLITSLPITNLPEGRSAGRMVLDEPRGIYAEAVRTARTAVLLSAVDISHKVIAVTSSVPEEGKSTFSMNLALTHAHTKRTLLIDADMRRPSVARTLGLPPGVPGLSQLVAGTATIEECVIPVPGSDLNVITAGKIPPNPLELLLSSKFEDTIRRLQRHYDFIVIDTPPVNLVSDALVISQVSTGMLFVVRAESTPVPVARRAIKQLRGAKAPLIGFCINRLDFKRAEKYYGDYGAYGYGGYGKKKGYYGSDTAYGSAPEGEAKAAPAKKPSMVARAMDAVQQKTGT